MADQPSDGTEDYDDLIDLSDVVDGLKKHNAGAPYRRFLMIEDDGTVSLAIKLLPTEGGQIFELHDSKNVRGVRQLLGMTEPKT